jgi:hypothetical protein
MIIDRCDVRPGAFADIRNRGDAETFLCKHLAGTFEKPVFRVVILIACRFHIKPVLSGKIQMHI